MLGRGAIEDVETDAKPVINGFVEGSVLGAKRLWVNSLLESLRFCCGSVLILRLRLLVSYIQPGEIWGCCYSQNRRCRGFGTHVLCNSEHKHRPTRHFQSDYPDAGMRSHMAEHL